MNANEVVAIVVHRQGKGKSCECELDLIKDLIWHCRKYLLTILYYKDTILYSVCSTFTMIKPVFVFDMSAGIILIL